MITSKHIAYQNPAEADHNWVETFQFPIVVPEEHLYALVYVNVRPTLGVMWNQVMIAGTLTESRSDLLHYNENHYLPAPKELSNIDSPFGLKIRGVDLPRVYDIDYEHEDGTEIHVTWSGLMDPFDIHDPNHSPQAGKDLGMGTHYTGQHSLNGHFDMSGRVTGTIKVRGRTFNVNSIERMDRSWGPRDYNKMHEMFIVSASFEPDLAFHMICLWYPDKVGTEAFKLTHGYVLEGDKVYGLTSEAVIKAQHHGLICTNLKMTVNDIRGKQYKLTAFPNVGAPWVVGNAVMHNTLMDWTYEGKDGYGVILKTHFLRELIRRRGRFENGQTAAIYV